MVGIAYRMVGSALSILAEFPPKQIIVPPHPHPHYYNGKGKGKGNVR